ncbi:MAG: hypothetical protein B6D39_01715 [Anaerolineae bacterium UTCFX2]|jgi:hypothetical protein|nr:DUF3592 domain-containing protein [Anaerolineae bacterium]MCZ7552679.1 DUF3592 domain-containing protein [Anaerolineales bacterium]OQY94222.1 MAG: hypothetical protein B6D39_01715 [Anaerolineae bacterium UTCFX2]
MDSPKRRLSLWRILWTDYPAFYAALVPVVAWIVYLAWTPDWRGAGPVIKAEAHPIFLTLAFIATGGGLAVLLIRLWILWKAFKTGVEVKGKISSVELKRDHGRVEYVYIFDHQEYFSSAEVHRNAETRLIKAGDHVTLIVDKTKPSRAFIRDLYTE